MIIRVHVIKWQNMDALIKISHSQLKDDDSTLRISSRPLIKDQLSDRTVTPNLCQFILSLSLRQYTEFLDVLINQSVWTF